MLRAALTAACAATHPHTPQQLCIAAAAIAPQQLGGLWWQQHHYQGHQVQQQQQQQQQLHHQLQQWRQQHTQHQQPDQQQQHHHQEQHTTRQVIYRGKWILPARFLVRAKVFQLMGGGSIALLVGSLTLQEASLSDVLVLAALAGGMAAASCCLWFYSRRYVGELSLLLPDRDVARFSVLDFWGNREDVDVPVAAIQPPLRGARPNAVERLAGQLLFPVNVAGEARRQFYLSIASGHILVPATFMAILKGEPLPAAAGGAPPAPAAAAGRHESQPREAAGARGSGSDGCGSSRDSQV